MASSDEGEIVDNGKSRDLKATSLPKTNKGSGVDRQDRTRPRYDSSDVDTASRYSSSSRRSTSPRGYKRSYDDRESYARGDDRDLGRNRKCDSRNPRYDDRRSDNYQRSRVSYQDLDRPSSRGSYLDYDSADLRERDRASNGHRDSDRHYNKRPHNRSRSPYRTRRADKGGLDDRFVRENRSERESMRYDGTREGGGQGYASNRTWGEASRAPRYDAKQDKGLARNDEPGNNQQRQPAPRKELSPEPDYEEPEIIDEDAEIERRRKRREEILAKSSSVATPLLVQATGAATAEKTRAESPVIAPGSPRRDVDTPQTPRTPRSDLASDRSPGSPMNILDENNLWNKHAIAKADQDDGPSAADYDPTSDMKEDERRDELRHGQVVLHGESHAVETAGHKPEAPLPSKPEKNEDDDFDMFADDFDEDKYTTKVAPVIAPVEAIELEQANARGGILEGADQDGYYKIRVGEILNGRYQVQATLGRGMFSSVVGALDVTTKKTVAIKIIRNNDALRKGGYTEIAILEKLNNADHDNRKHIIKFERSFDYRGHLCMTFESLSLNLREVLRKFGNNVGINLGATRTYAHQIFVALAHMRKCSIIHADLKPDNILVNDSRNTLKICDLGTAIDRADAATAQTIITPYLVSRFYRAPEIILGMPYDYSVDMWSIGCTLYELYTGKILFTGDSNNQMLRAIMEVRGRLTPKLFKRGQLSAQHFDDMGQFVSVERDKVLGKTIVRTLPMVKPIRDLRTRLTAASSGMNDGEARELNHFIDLLDHCLTLNPDKRIKPADALRHPFFTAKR